MSKEITPPETLGTPSISKTMSAFYQMGDAPVLIRDWNDSYNKRQIELKPLHQAREEQYCLVRNELERLDKVDKTLEKYNLDDNWLESALYCLVKHLNSDLAFCLKEHKALEIIKLKQVNVHSFIQRNPKTFEEYQDIDDEIEQLSEVSLSKREYNLLKEVLL